MGAATAMGMPKPRQSLQCAAERPGYHHQQQTAVGHHVFQSSGQRADRPGFVGQAVKEQGRPQHSQHEQRQQQPARLRYPPHLPCKPEPGRGAGRACQPGCRSGFLRAPAQPCHKAQQEQDRKGRQNIQCR